MKKRVVLFLAIIIFIFAGSCSAESTREIDFAENAPSGTPVSEQLYALASNSGEISVSDRTFESGILRMRQKTYEFPNGDNCRYIRFETLSGAQTVRFTEQYAGKSGTYRYYDPVNGNWVVMMLQGRLPRATVYITIDGADMVLCPPLAYRSVEDGTILAMAENDGCVTVERKGGCFVFEYEIPLQDAIYADMFRLTSPEQLIDWQNEVMQSIWKGYDLTHDNRFCMDGYYYVTPENYLPSGKDYYWRNPSAYISCKFITTGGSRAAEDLGISMLDMLSQNINKAGYFDSLPVSLWLNKDYDIRGGFFDTRFNCDIFEAYLIAYQKFGIPEFLKYAVDFGGFFASHAENSHFSFVRYDFEGWLVEDYAHPEGNKPSHVSLNHQVREIILLYRLSEATNEKGWADLAFRLLEGIRFTADDWIREDSNLNYAHLPDGSYGLADYPYLTYNDLYDLRRVLRAQTGKNDEYIQRLMDAKQLWMDKNGITGYKK